LVPKRAALANPERTAARVARPMRLLSRLAAPAVWLLKVSTEGILRLLGLSRAREASVTEDEVKSLIAEGTRAGIFAPQEREMIEGVLRLADRPVRVIMTPRAEIAWIDVAADRAAIARIVEANRVAGLLVCEGSIDRVIGSVHSKNLLPLALAGSAIDLASAMTPIVAVLDSTPVLALLNRFRRERVHMAAVVDEYGVTDGMVTLTDVLEAIAGEFPEPGEAFEPPLLQREDGSWLADGALPIDELEDRLQLPGLSDEGPFDTLAGFVLQRLGHLPSPGESFVHRGMRFEVVDMDRRRIDKVVVTPEG
ncbi:MAG: hemolysin family protein, partial [Kiloniellales bacterium]